MDNAMDDEMDEQQEELIKEYTLGEMSELRLECTKPGDVFIQLMDGSAEIFGAELQLGSKVNVKGLKLAVFSWKGCKLQIEGYPAISYQAADTPMASYLDLHNKLNLLRDQARTAQAGSNKDNSDGQALAQGPRLIILGPTDSGKSSLTRMLLNWGVRSGWEPTFVDLDVGQGSITVPGCIAAVPVECPLDPEEGAAGLDLPLVLFYGSANAGDNPELYKWQVDRLAEVLEKRAASNSTAAASGLVVNTLGWTDGIGFELQLHAIQALKADHVVVIEQDRLFNQVKAALQGRGIEVIKLKKSGGVVERSRDERRAARDAQIRNYFYGPRGNLMPVSQMAKADLLKVFRIGGGPKAPTSALPIGAIASGDPLRVSHVPVGPELVQSLLAVSHAEVPDQVLSANVAGFILVKEVDVIRNTVTFVSPCPGQLPGRYLISGALRSAMD